MEIKARESQINTWRVPKITDDIQECSVHDIVIISTLILVPISPLGAHDAPPKPKPNHSAVSVSLAIWCERILSYLVWSLRIHSLSPPSMTEGLHDVTNLFLWLSISWKTEWGNESTLIQSVSSISACMSLINVSLPPGTQS